MFTSGIVSILGAHRIALFFTGPRHAGENLAAVLKQRAAELDRPIQMCDALSRNMPKELQTIVANCLTHTCELNGVNAFEYLTTLHRHAQELSLAPADWMPWNYREAL